MKLQLSQKEETEPAENTENTEIWEYNHGDFYLWMKQSSSEDFQNYHFDH